MSIQKGNVNRFPFSFIVFSLPKICPFFRQYGSLESFGMALKVYLLFPDLISIGRIEIIIVNQEINLSDFQSHDRQVHRHRPLHGQNSILLI